MSKKEIAIMLAMCVYGECCDLQVSQVERAGIAAMNDMREEGLI